MLATNRLTWFVLGGARIADAGGLRHRRAAHRRRCRSTTAAPRSKRASPARTSLRRSTPARIEKDANPVTSKEDPRWQWCEQRHIDHQAGKAPGGATDLNKKLEDDRVCAAVYQRG